MAKVISVHEYELKPGVQDADFERALHDAERRGLLDLPGLTAHHFLRGLKGARRGAYTAIWIFESREAWERLWGTVEAPRSAAEYPENYDEPISAPLFGLGLPRTGSTALSFLLAQDPDTIRFTSYEEV